MHALQRGSAKKMTKDKRALPRPKNAVSAALDRIGGDRPVTVALFLLLAGLLIVMARFLWGNVWLTLNADEASEMVLAKILADEGSILSKIGIILPNCACSTPT